MQQLTCKIDLSNSFYCLFFSFVLLELKPFVLKGEVLGEKVSTDILQHDIRAQAALIIKECSIRALQLVSIHPVIISPTISRCHRQSS